MTVAQAAEMIGISPSKLYQLASARRISHYRIDGKILFGEEDVVAFRASCHVEISPAATGPHQPQPRLKHLSLG